VRFKPILLLLLLASTLPSISIQPASPISQPRYLEKIPRLSPDLIAYHSGHLYVHDLAKSVIAVIDPGSGEVREVDSPKMLRKLEVSGDRIFLLTQDGRVLVKDLEGSRSMELGIPARAEDLEVSGDSLWVSIPSLGLLRRYDLEGLEPVGEVRAWVAPGLGKFSVLGGVLWAILGDYRTLMRYDLSRGSNSTKGFEARLQAVEAFGGGALIATAGDEVIALDDGLRVLGSWRLERGSAAGIILHRLGDGRIIYVSPSRWVVGEIEGGEVREVWVDWRGLSGRGQGLVHGAQARQDRLGLILQAPEDPGGQG